MVVAANLDRIALIVQLDAGAPAAVQTASAAIVTPATLPREFVAGSWHAALAAVAYADLAIGAAAALDLLSAAAVAHLAAVGHLQGALGGRRRELAATLDARLKGRAASALGTAVQCASAAVRDAATLDALGRARGGLARQATPGKGVAGLVVAAGLAVQCTPTAIG